MVKLFSTPLLRLNIDKKFPVLMDNFFKKKQYVIVFEVTFNSWREQK